MDRIERYIKEWKVGLKEDYNSRVGARECAKALGWPVERVRNCARFMDCYVVDTHGGVIDGWKLLGKVDRRIKHGNYCLVKKCESSCEDSSIVITESIVVTEDVLADGLNGDGTGDLYKSMGLGIEEDETDSVLDSKIDKHQRFL